MKKTNKVEDDDHKDRTQAFVKEDSKRNRQEKPIDEDKIVALRTAREPRSVGWIARDLHCSEEKVIDVLKKRGIWEGNET